VLLAVVKLQDLKGKDTDLENHNSSVLPNTNNDWEFKFLLRFQTFPTAHNYYSDRFYYWKSLPFQNAYWIVLTIVVIMRQGYGEQTTHLSSFRFSRQIYCFWNPFFSSWLNNHWWISNHRTTFWFHLLQLIKSWATFITIYVIFIYEF
jgi:hypothetical protein